MATLNYATREISCKIIYYGPALGGKTTNLQRIYATVSAKHRGKLISLATDQDRTLFFDFLPLDLGEVRGFQTKFQLYTVPGQVHYNATRKLVLRGVDGLVFVVDSQAARLRDNLESLANLQENLAEYGYRLGDLPWVIQYNKRDLPDALPAAELERRINSFGVDHAEAIACRGQGVKETLKLISAQVLGRLGRSPEPAPRAVSAASTARAPEAAGLPMPPNAEASAKGENRLTDSHGAPSGPRKLAIRQRCDVYWRGLRLGTASIELTSRSNFDGKGEYQLAEAGRLLLVFRRVALDILAYSGEEARHLDNQRVGLYVFGGVEDGKGACGGRLSVWVRKGGDQSVLIRRRGLGGEYVYTPAGRGRREGLAWVGRPGR